MFYEDLKKGKKGESLFLTYYSNKFKKVLDVTDNKSYQSMDIDFLVDNCWTLDVKFNYKDTGFIPVEEFTNEKPYVQGWLEKSKADIICCLSFSTAIFIKLPLFIDWYETNRYKYELVHNELSYGNNGCSWRSAYRWVKLSDIPENIYKLVFNF